MSWLIPSCIALKSPCLAIAAWFFLSSSAFLPVSFANKSKSLAYFAVASCIVASPAPRFRPDIISIRWTSIIASPISSCVMPRFLSCIPYLLPSVRITVRFFKNCCSPSPADAPNPANASLLLPTSLAISFTLRPAAVELKVN